MQRRETCTLYTHGCWFLISLWFNIMHLWWGGGEEQVHNVDYDPVKTVGGGVNRCIMLVMHLVNLVYRLDQSHLNPLHRASENVASQSGIEPGTSCTAGERRMHHTTVWALDSPHLHLNKTTYWPLILMALCIIDFIGANALLWPVAQVMHSPL